MKNEPNQEMVALHSQNNKVRSVLVLVKCVACQQRILVSKPSDNVIQPCDCIAGGSCGANVAPYRIASGSTNKCLSRYICTLPLVPCLRALDTADNGAQAIPYSTASSEYIETRFIYFLAQVIAPGLRTYPGTYLQ
jgi:hypothetical protein